MNESAVIAPPTLTRPSCKACNAAYRREALHLLDRVKVSESRNGLLIPWGAIHMSEAVSEINHEPAPYQWVAILRAWALRDGIDVRGIPAAQHCGMCR